MLKTFAIALLSLLMISACSENPVSDTYGARSLSFTADVNLSGAWRGQFTVEYAGDDGWPVAQTSPAVITFGEGEFSYTVATSPDNNSDPVPPPFGKMQTPIVPGGQGTYHIPQRGQVSFSGLTFSSGTSAAFRLEGTFQYRLEDKTLTLRQELSEPFEVVRELVLTKSR